VSDVAHEPDLSLLACDPARLSIGQREVQIQADGGPVTVGVRPGGSTGMAGRAETMQIVCDFSAAKILADGFCRDSDAHIDIRREAQRQTRPRRSSKLHVAAQTRTHACRLDVLALSLRVDAAREDTAAIGP
jgi:hypothetical protein